MKKSLTKQAPTIPLELRTKTGAAQYRKGEWQAAIDSFEELRRRDRYNLDLPAYGYFMAMCWWQQGNADEANRWYDKTVTAMNLSFAAGSGMHIPDWQIAELRKEAAQLLGRDQVR